MDSVLRRTVVIGPEGRVEIPTTELAPGSTAEILVLPIVKTPPRPLSPEERAARVQRLRAMSDKAIVEGMEVWDIDRVNAEVHERRYGDRERYS